MAPSFKMSLVNLTNILQWVGTVMYNIMNNSRNYYSSLGKCS